MNSLFEKRLFLNTPTPPWGTEKLAEINNQPLPAPVIPDLGPWTQGEKESAT